ncbi:ATP-dependent nuclease [Algoriphagus sediminis]|uniref:AAA family ATPase n=1 Tax=Algoriphagus sediminis TaxID=3057113 RepID=A0ABT7YC65_9BACT|nr:AAA family ATPase [Algoriphagus sediminis]MDN3203774.1 AAA family ATPase [Algoriphagus sediminis]
MRSKLLDITIKNLGCIGDEGLTVDLDNILCLVGNNNTGKSTVLRAYELAVGNVNYDTKKDRCNYSDKETSIEISVHIPEGVENIAEKWKEVDGDFRRIKSKWTWDKEGNKTRQTYDPESGEYAEEGNAAGLDNVFKSRLPIPFRIGALESPQAELKQLLKLIVEPIGLALKKKLEDDKSELNKALKAFNIEATKPVEAEKEKIEKYGNDISKSHSSVFPNLGIDLSIGLAEIDINPIDYLLRGSNLTITEFEQTVNWVQQGTGSKRALFWSLLQVRSRLQSINTLKSETEKRCTRIESEIRKLEKERDNVVREATKADKTAKIEALLAEYEELKGLDPEGQIEQENEGSFLPGFMLLIDEPEVALHPNGIRAASKYLYELAQSNSWQIMLTTHSPLFINPFEDNTTIVRLDRNKKSPSPKTYRSDSISFSPEEKDQLTLLNTFDQNLSEMFFGQYPIIIEGDTEFAGFQRVMEIESEKYPISARPLFIRARGKFTILPLIKMLSHFKVDFSVLHDSDYPKNKAGKPNGVWTFNKVLFDEIENSRKGGLRIVHRLSITTLELELFGVRVKDGKVKLPSSSAKPYALYHAVFTDKGLKDRIESLLDELLSKKADQEAFENGCEGMLEYYQQWVKENGITDKRFVLE